MEEQEMEMKWKLEMEMESGNQKLKTEMETQPLSCCTPSFLGIPVHSLPPVFALLA